MNFPPCITSEVPSEAVINKRIAQIGLVHFTDPPVHGLPRIDYRNGLPEWTAKWTTLYYLP